MKELSIEQKAKRYDESLEKSKRLYEQGTITEILCYVFPELAESEDERIRKWIIDDIRYNMNNEPLNNSEYKKNAEKAIAWLEAQGEHANFRNAIQIGDKVTRNEDGVLVNLSQLNRVAKKDEKKGEQKPVENKGMNLVEEEMTPFQKKVFCIIDTTIEEEQGLKQVCDELLRLAHNEIMNEQNPVWSEEDEKMCQETIDWFEKKCFPYALESENPARESIKWLKSLKERYTWKPSDEQMKALWNVYQGGKEQAELATLYNDLKKLREE